MFKKLKKRITFLKDPKNGKVFELQYTRIRYLELFFNPNLNNER